MNHQSFLKIALTCKYTFIYSIYHEIFSSSHKNYRYPTLETLRLAPSASNKQPWRVVKQGKAFHLYLLETPGYDKMIKSINLQRVDMGITMLHFKLTCKELNLNGIWHIQQPDIENNQTKYLTSWTADL